MKKSKNNVCLWISCTVPLDTGFSIEQSAHCMFLGASHTGAHLSHVALGVKLSQTYAVCVKSTPIASCDKSELGASMLSQMLRHEVNSKQILCGVIAVCRSTNKANRLNGSPYLLQGAFTSVRCVCREDSMVHEICFKEHSHQWDVFAGNSPKHVH